MVEVFTPSNHSFRRRRRVRSSSSNSPWSQSSPAPADAAKATMCISTKRTVPALAPTGKPFVLPTLSATLLQIPTQHHAASFHFTSRTLPPCRVPCPIQVMVLAPTSVSITVCLLPPTLNRTRRSDHVKEFATRLCCATPMPQSRKALDLAQARRPRCTHEVIQWPVSSHAESCLCLALCSLTRRAHLSFRGRTIVV